MIFTETDKKIMNIILKYKPIYEVIYKKTLRYKFNITKENIQLKNMNIETEDLDTKKIEKYFGVMVGMLNYNKFTWAYPELMCDQFKKNIENLTKVFKFPKDVIDLLNKLCSVDSIEFEEKYREIILLTYSLIFNPEKVNIIRFDDGSDRNLNSLFHINVSVSLSKEILTYIDDIFTELENFDKKNITAKSNRIISKQEEGRIKIHKMKRIIYKELKDLLKKN